MRQVVTKSQVRRAEKGWPVQLRSHSREPHPLASPPSENASPAVSIAAAVAPMTDCTHWAEMASPSSLESLGAALGRPVSLSRVDVTFANSQDASCLRAKPACGSPGQGALAEGLCVCRVELG